MRSDRKFPLLAPFPKHLGFSEKGHADEQDKGMDVLRNSSKVRSSLYAVRPGKTRAIFPVLELICGP